MIVRVPKIQNRAHDPDHAHLGWFVTYRLGLTMVDQTSNLCIHIGLVDLYVCTNLKYLVSLDSVIGMVTMQRAYA